MLHIEMPGRKKVIVKEQTIYHGKSFHESKRDDNIKFLLALNSFLKFDLHIHNYPC